MTKPSPFAPESLPTLPPVAGVTMAAAEAGIRYRARKDLLLVQLRPRHEVGGALTRSATPSPAVNWCRARLAAGRRARALVVNSGNANAFTGQRGADAVAMTADIAAKSAGCAPEEVFLASTGVIGEPLDVSAFADTLRGLGRNCARRVGRRRPRDHDHRHLSQAGLAHHRDRRRAGHDQRHRQRLRHDRAEHGDDARLRVHRRPALLREHGADRCARTRWRRASTASRWTATPRPATPLLCSPRAQRARGAPRDRRSRTIRGWKTSGWRSTNSRSIWRIRWSRTARG